MRKPYVWLVLAAALFAAMLATLLFLTPGHGTSPDSQYYLQSATGLQTGRGYRLQIGDSFVWNSTFPIGYSALIAGVSWLLNCSVLVASKLVNLGAILLSSWLWLGRLPLRQAVWFLSLWWLGGFVRLAAFTWSEAVFLVLLLEWVWALHRLSVAPNRARALLVLLLLYSLFLVRYVGGFTTILTAGIALVTLIKARGLGWIGLPYRPKTGLLLTAISAMSTAGILAYFYLNWRMAGAMYGGERFDPTESIGTLLRLFSLSLLNECLLLRDFVPGESTALAWVGVGLQAGLFILVWFGWRVAPLTQVPPFPPMARLLVVTSITYVVVLFALRTFSPFSGPNARLMAPATFCLLAAVLLWAGSLHNEKAYRRLWAALLLLSWLQVLPQVNPLNKLKQVAKPLLAALRLHDSASTQHSSGLIIHRQYVVTGLERGY